MTAPRTWAQRALLAVLFVAMVTAPIAAAPPSGPEGEPRPQPQPETPVPDTPAPTASPAPNGTPSASPPNASEANPMMTPGGVNLSDGTGPLLPSPQNFTDAIINGTTTYLLEQGEEAVNATVGQALTVAVSTPAPNNAGNWFRNPTNGAWPQRYDRWKEMGQPLALVLLILGGGLTLAFGRYGLGTLGPAQEQDSLRWWFFGLLFTMFGWQFVGLFLGFTDLLGQAFVSEATGTGLTAVVNGIGVILLAILLIWIEVGVLIAMILILGARIAALVALAPFIPALVAARSIPIGVIKGAASSITTVFVILTLAVLPTAWSLSVALGTGTGAVLDGVGAGELTQIIVKVGALGLAVVFPFLMFYLAKGFVSMPSAGQIKQTGQQTRRAMPTVAADGGTRVRDRAGSVRTNARDAVRGARYQVPASDSKTPTRGYRAGIAARQTATKGRQYSQSVTDRAAQYRNRLRDNDS